MLFYLGVLLATIIFYLFKFHYDLVRQWYMALKIPGPVPALPLIGNGLLFLNRSPTGKIEIFRLEIDELYRQCFDFAVIEQRISNLVSQCC